MPATFHCEHTTGLLAAHQAEKIHTFLMYFLLRCVSYSISVLLNAPHTQIYYNTADRSTDALPKMRNNFTVIIFY
jgi:TorA maturation chaperone TorD